MRKKCGQSLLEILFAIICFVIAAIPITKIFSFSMENTKIIQAKLITYAATSEIINQIVLIPIHFLKGKVGAGVIPIPAETRTFFLVENEEKTKLNLTPLPTGYSRKIAINQRDSEPEGLLVTVTIKTLDQTKGDMEMSQTVSQSLGGL